MKSPVPLPILTVFFAACSPSGDLPPLSVQRDSAGITIVESFAPAWGDSARWRVGVEPLLDLAESGAGDAHYFNSVRDVRRLPDGGIVVANRGSVEIRKFSADGEFVGSAGGSGEGSGEFTNLQQIELAGDSLLGLDWDGRMAIFGRDLGLVHTMWPDPGVSKVRYLSDGIMVVEILVPELGTVGLARWPSVLVLFDLEGVAVDTIGWTPGFEEYANDILSMAPLFGKSSVLDSHGDRIFVGSSDHMQIEELNTSGDTVRILRIPDYPLALTAEQVRAERDARLDISLPPGVSSLPPHYVEAVEDLPSQETRPAYAGMLVDATGATWLQRFRGLSERDGPELWLVLGPEGDWLGSVEIPEDFWVTDIGVDEILGIWTDELDVQHPQVRHLARG
ncbi:MAG: hypothetical protein OXH66_19425 [Gemmatimonadetes bacterium]|nr:hypothetical protein [Gemmatimonadota bacterium]